MLYWDVEAYIKGWNVSLTSKAVWHKFYENLQALSVSTHGWKNLSMDFVTRLPVLTDWKSESYDVIFVIIDRLTKIVHYKSVKITIDRSGLAKVIIDVMVWHHGLSDFIIINWGSLFTSKFWFLLCYFLKIKRKLSTVFHSQTSGQISKQNSTIKAYFRAFVN